MPDRANGTIGETAHNLMISPERLVELRGIEPLTSAVRLQRSPI